MRSHPGLSKHKRSTKLLSFVPNVQVFHSPYPYSLPPPPHGVWLIIASRLSFFCKAKRIDPQLVKKPSRIIYKPYRSITSMHHLSSTIMVLLRSSAFALVLSGLVHAAAIKRQAITSLTSTQIASYTPFTHFASTAYCNASTTINWSCGGAPLAARSTRPVQP